jgi:FAD/FMN-containing dehydrogenase
LPLAFSNFGTVLSIGCEMAGMFMTKHSLFHKSPGREAIERSTKERTMNELTDVLKHFCGQLRHRISMPGSAGYASATAIWAKPLGPMPRAIVHCVTTEDVQLAVRAARESGLPISVRGGGHDWAGRALCDGVVIDLREMNRVVIDSDHCTAQIAGGARATGVLAVTDPLGLAAVAGSVGSVGMAGLTLGGGYGALIGRFGLALDNLHAAEVVLADGRTVVAESHSEEELLWALRGGGGNFGVVTAMQVRLHDLRSVRSGMLVYPFSEARAVLKGCADIAASAPDELTAQVGLVTGADGSLVVMIVPTWCGTRPEGESRLAAFLKLGTVLTNTVDDVPYGTSLSVFDPYLATGQHTSMETCWIAAFNDDCIDMFLNVMANTLPGCAIFTHEFKGAASRVVPGATAFGLRCDHVLVELLATFPGQSAFDQRNYQRWLHTSLHAFDPIALPGGYPNLLPKGDADRATKSFGDNAERLIKAKRTYDPDNIFRSAIPLPVATGSEEAARLIKSC